jgi:hypothetical protein
LGRKTGTEGERIAASMAAGPPVDLNDAGFENHLVIGATPLTATG